MSLKTQVAIRKCLNILNFDNILIIDIAIDVIEALILFVYLYVLY